MLSFKTNVRSKILAQLIFAIKYKSIAFILIYSYSIHTYTVKQYVNNLINDNL